MSDHSAYNYLFDEFAYRSLAELEVNGWTVRSASGWPGSPGAVWDRELVRLVDAPDSIGVLQLSARMGKETRQSQICHRRKFFEGTYAARVRFSDHPVSGRGGDEMVMSFYGITPYDRPLDPAYSEMDFEYLPNGGWGLPAQTLVSTTWETVQIEPWDPRNASNHRTGGFSGWHTLVIEAVGGTVVYSVDGRRLCSHEQPNYPTSPMSINFNLWCIDGGRIDSDDERVYTEEIDWVFFARGRALAPDEVVQRIESLRANGVRRFDDVPESDPPLDCPCDM